MILASSIYQDVQDALLKEGNGDYNISLHNRYSRLGEIKLLDWITGDITGRQPPEPYTTQKDKDWAAPFIVKYKKHLPETGELIRPADYYGFENFYGIGYATAQDCKEDDEPNASDPGNTPITLLDGGQFTKRCRTYIEELKPTSEDPIAKMVGKTIECYPKDLGSVCLEYYRYPVFAEIKTTIDPVYNEEVPDEATTKNYEWDEKARPLLVWFIVDMFSNRIANQSQKSFNAATGKTPHQQG